MYYCSIIFKLKFILDSNWNVKLNMLYIGYLPDQWSFDTEDVNEFTYKINNGVWHLSSYIISWESINALLNKLPIFGPTNPNKIDTGVPNKDNCIKCAQYNFLKLQ